LSQEKINKMNDCSSIMFFGITDTIEISKSDFKIVRNDFELEIKFNNSEIVKKIGDIECNKIQFCIDDNLLTAKSNPVFSSKVPNDADYFFSINFDGSLMSVKDEKTLYLRRILN
jgi:hypothetical protein